MQSSGAYPATGQEVVFVCDKPHSRIAKVGYGLKSLGCRVVLLHRDALPTKYADRSFDETHCYRDPAGALELARRFRPLMYHVFSSWDFATAALLLKERPGRIVFDDYDVASGVVRPEFLAANYPTLQESERFCLEQADGITCRDLLLQSTKRRLDYRIGRKLLYLPDCCWCDQEEESAWSKGIEADSLQLAYAGNMAIEKYAPTPHPRDNFYFLDFAREITASGIHFHVYPSPNFCDGFEEQLSEHLELAEKSAFYHVHRPLPADQLVSELSRYDLGLLSMWRETRDSNKAYLPVIFSHSTSNKLFDYMDAGLGIVTCDALRFQRWFLGKHDICVSGYLDEATRTILSRPLSFWRGLRKRVRLARNSFSATLHARRLLAFYLAVNGQAAALPQKGAHLALAQEAMQRGELEVAIIEARAELAQHPDDADTRRFLSFLQSCQQKWERMVPS